MRRILAGIALAALLGADVGAADPSQQVTIRVQIVTNLFAYGSGSGEFTVEGALTDGGTAYLGQWSLPGWGWGWSPVWDLTLCGSVGTAWLTLENGAWTVTDGVSGYAGLQGNGTYEFESELLSLDGGPWGTPLFLHTYVLTGTMQTD